MGKAARKDHREAQRAAQQEAARRSERRRHRRPYLIAGTVVASAALVGTLLLVGSSSSRKNQESGSNQLPRGAQVFAEANRTHVTGTVTYDRTPPAGGAHSAVWLNCGIYSQPVPNEIAVHSLEHGAVWITYRPDLSPADVTLLQQFAATHYQGTQRYLVLSPYRGLPSPVVATAWGAQIKLTGSSDPRLAPFVNHYEGGGQGGEKGAECTGGTGTPA